MKRYRNIFNSIANSESLFRAWDEFKRGKGKKEDVIEFEKNLEHHIFALSRDITSGRYRHGGYSNFFISDPKRRHIHKASVRDRVLHHTLMSTLYPLFNPTFIDQSFSCRVGKGTHKGIACVRSMLRKESNNATRTCYALKCDIQKFFDSVDHHILIDILQRIIRDGTLMKLLVEIIESYTGSQSNLFHRVGLPIGNLTSQLFANVYMNEFDQFMKHTLKVKHYARYTDDFVIVSADKGYLESIIEPINEFLTQKLHLNLHPEKVVIRKYSQGIDFLGHVIFPHYTLLRKRTKKRVVRKVHEAIKKYHQGDMEKEKVDAMMQLYLGILSHSNSHTISRDLLNNYWLSGDRDSLT
jgi:RNA-directed DNA polymerase